MDADDNSHTSLDIGEVNFVDTLSGHNYGDVSGDLTLPGTVGREDSSQYNTLDEPIKDTIMRDLRAVGVKFYHVLYPKEKKSLLKEWDLWGPLILCTFLAVMLQGEAETIVLTEKGSTVRYGGGPQFAEVFIIVWAGAAVVTLNSKLLGGRISFFQSVCVLGYCLLPGCIALIVCRVLLFFSHSTFTFIIRFCVSSVGFAWATFAAMMFLSDSQLPGRRGLAVYPIFLFYLVISWLIVSNSDA
ncbi:Yip1 domain [Trinorchestia longiramus]|nr:Yip1 domain [Trinorchestia longiramus]